MMSGRPPAPPASRQTPSRTQDQIDEVLIDSFPASDPPPWTLGAGGPAGPDAGPIEDTASTPTALGIEFVDVPIARLQAAPIRFTLFWPAAERWEGRDIAITVEKSPA